MTTLKGAFELFYPHCWGEYSPENAYCMALASELAYQDEDDVQRMYRAWGFSRSELLEAGSTQATYAESKDAGCAILAFRGTQVDDKEDWKTDADFRKVSWGHLELHRGFLEAYREIESQVVEKLSEAFLRRRSLWITGHSLGGALAAVCAINMGAHRDHSRYMDEFLKGVYTFGQPRVGDIDAARRLDELLSVKYYVVRNNNDIVSCVPPEKLGYKHGGTCVLIKSWDEETAKGGKVVVDPSDAELILDRLEGMWEDLGEPGIDKFKDHKLQHNGEGYIPRLRDAIPKI